MKRITTLFVSALLLTYAQAGVAQTLRQTVIDALKSNPDLLITAKQRLAVGQQLNASYSGFLPTVSVSAGIGQEMSKNSTTLASTQGYDDMTRQELGVRVEENLFDGFATSNEVKRNKARTRADTWQVMAGANDTTFRVTDAYINVLRRQKLKAVSQKTVRRLAKLSNMISKRVKRGVSKRVDYVQSEGRLALAQSNFRTSIGEYLQSKAAFLRVVGKMPRHLVEPRFNDRLLPRSQEEAIKIALKYHPVIRVSFADIEEAKAQHQFAQSGFYPRVDLVLSGSRNRNVDGVRAPNYDMSAMVQARWNLFKGGADYFQVKRTAYLVQESMQVQRRAFRQTIESIQLSWAAYTTAKRSMRFVRAHVTAARKTVRAYESQFKIGQRSLLDLLDAENEYFVSLRSFVDTRYNLLLSKYRIFNSVGQILVLLRVAAPPSAQVHSGLHSPKHPALPIHQFHDLIEKEHVDPYKKPEMMPLYKSKTPWKVAPHEVVRPISVVKVMQPARKLVVASAEKIKTAPKSLPVQFKKMLVKKVNDDSFFSSVTHALSNNKHNRRSIVATKALPSIAKAKKIAPVVTAKRAPVMKPPIQKVVAKTKDTKSFFGSFKAALSNNKHNRRSIVKTEAVPAPASAKMLNSLNTKLTQAIAAAKKTKAVVVKAKKEKNIFDTFKSALAKNKHN